MRVFGIIGYPLAHTRSPAMHQAALDAAGIAGAYMKFEVREKDLVQGVQEMRELGVEGFNVTLPFKESIIPLLDGIDDTARAIGAVNTVVRVGGEYIGTNTDAAGLTMSLVEENVRLSGTTAIVIGAGGAARAATLGLSFGGAFEVKVAARRFEEARRLCRDTKIGLPIDLAYVGEHFQDCTLLVQATSATLHGSTDAQAFADSLPLDELPDSCAVVDLVYEPEWTTVRLAAAAAGLQTVGGLGMLLHQGALAFERWTGDAPPIEAMRAAITQSL